MCFTGDASESEEDDAFVGRASQQVARDSRRPPKEIRSCRQSQQDPGHQGEEGKLRRETEGRVPGI